MTPSYRDFEYNPRGKDDVVTKSRDQVKYESVFKDPQTLEEELVQFAHLCRRRNDHRRATLLQKAVSRLRKNNPHAIENQVLWLLQTYPGKDAPKQVIDAWENARTKLIAKLSQEGTL